MMHRVEKQHRDIGPVTAEHVDEDDTFGLEAGRDTRRSSAFELQLHEFKGSGVDHVSISSSMARTASIAASSLAAARAACARRSAAPGAAPRAPSGRAFTIMPAPAVKLD